MRLITDVRPVSSVPRRQVHPGPWVHSGLEHDGDLHRVLLHGVAKRQGTACDLRAMARANKENARYLSLLFPQEHSYATLVADWWRELFTITKRDSILDNQYPAVSVFCARSVGPNWNLRNEDKRQIPRSSSRIPSIKDGAPLVIL